MVRLARVAELLIEGMGGRSMDRACRFDASTASVACERLGRPNEFPSDAATPLGFIDDKGRETTPGAAFMSDENPISSRYTQQCLVVCRDENVCLRICDQSRESLRERVFGALIAELTEQTLDCAPIPHRRRANREWHRDLSWLIRAKHTSISFHH